MTATTARLDPSLAQYREGYPILASTTYMNSNSMGAMHVRARDALREYTDVWSREGGEAWEIWPSLVNEVADAAARFFGAPPGQTTLNQNVATLQGTVASCLDFSERNEVVIEELMFPNVLYVWERFTELGAKLRLVRSDDGMTIPTERMLEAITERTAVVSISHAVYVSGALQDVAAICARAHEAGAIVVCDGYQTIGTVPIDAPAWGLDIMVGGSHKWLCGGPGTCFMWVAPHVAERLRPRNTGWMAHAAPFAFEPPPTRYAATPWRFMSGTPSIPAYYVAREAYRDLHAIGIERIRAHNLALCDIIVRRALDRGLTVHSPLDPAKRTGFVAVDFPGSERACATLIEERFKLDWRPGCGLRMGPHFYNTREEVERLMDRVIALAGRA
jgi:kynureninase